MMIVYQNQCFKFCKMIKWLFKYSAVIFVFNSILLAITFMIPLGKIIFLTLMGLYITVFLMNINQLKNVIFHKAFSFLLFISILNFTYFIIFHNIFDLEAIKYLLARSMQFSILALSIYFSFDYYKTRFLDHLIYLAVIVIFIGFVVNPYLLSGRYSGLMWNPNMLSSFITIVFGVLLLKNDKFSRLDYFLLFLFFFVSLATGSRGSIVAIILAYVVRFGATRRNIIYGFLALIFTLFLLNLPYDTSVNRLFSQTIFNDRILQYDFAIQSIYEKFYTGYGLDKYSYIDMNLVPSYLRGKVTGAHNGFLAILTQYGVIFGSIILFIILKKSFKVIIWFRHCNGSERAFLYIIVYALFASVYESILTGINEFHTSLFWLALSFLSLSRYKLENEY